MSYTIAGIQFNVGDRYEVKKLLGAGAYGHVAQAVDKKNNEKVAIKKLHKIEDSVDCKRVLREIRILRSMDHENILRLKNLIYDEKVKEQDFGDVYLVTEYLEVDLHKIIKSGQNLTDQHMQYILYQLLKGLKYMHSANIVHRDIKPSNILATENCEICFCDFGLARQIEESENEDNKHAKALTEYVVTRYYRAPEVMLSSHEYSCAIDIWSLGCTFAELLTRQILFKGTNYIQMIKLIFETIGKPPDDQLAFITNQNARKYVQGLQTKPRTPIGTVLKYPNPDALDLLDKLLEINPQRRISAAEVEQQGPEPPVPGAGKGPGRRARLRGAAGLRLRAQPHRHARAAEGHDPGGGEHPEEEQPRAADQHPQRDGAVQAGARAEGQKDVTQSYNKSLIMAQSHSPSFKATTGPFIILRNFRHTQLQKQESQRKKSSNPKTKPKKNSPAFTPLHEPAVEPSPKKIHQLSKAHTPELAPNPNPPLPYQQPLPNLITIPYQGQNLQISLPQQFSKNFGYSYSIHNEHLSDEESQNSPIYLNGLPTPKSVQKNRKNHQDDLQNDFIL